VTPQFGTSLTVINYAPRSVSATPREHSMVQVSLMDVI
jgi:hypothetical protein